MNVAAEKLLSFDELYARIVALPEGVTGEIPQPGVLRTMSRPGRAHRHAAQNLFLALGSVNRGAAPLGGWWIEVEAEVRFGQRLFVPDLCGFRVERVPGLPEGNPIVIVPDLCVEVLSPSTATYDRRTKMPAYLDAGVAHVWLVEPEARLVEVYERDERGRPVRVQAAADDEGITLAPTDVPIELGKLWLTPP